MTLSRNMIESLQFIKQFTGPRIKCGRPGHYGNLRVHNALLKRGLIREARDKFHTTTLTERGERVLTETSQP